MRLPGSPVARLRRLARRLQERGDAVLCPVCGRRAARFLPYQGREGALCPSCGCAERHRVLWRWLGRRLDEGAVRDILVLGPDDATDRVLRRREGLRYVSCDVDPTQAMVAADITALPFADGSFDLVVCSHVLEHVGDETAALAELRRVVRAGGEAIVMVPVDRTHAQTVEDPVEEDPARRFERFGHPEHVRLYGRDVAERLNAETIDAIADAGPVCAAREGLVRADRFGPDELYRLRPRDAEHNFRRRR